MSFAQKSRKAPAALAEPALYDYALKALGRRMRTEAELRRLMQQRAEHGEPGQSAIKSVVARLREHGYLNDTAFAETFTRLRQENEKLGARRVRQKLAEKGVPSGIAQKAIENRYAATDEESLARQHLERKRIGKPENEKETARVVRRLVSAGFSTTVIYKILRRWDVPDESLTALENLDDDSPAE
jgi:regulatory protein